MVLLISCPNPQDCEYDRLLLTGDYVILRWQRDIAGVIMVTNQLADFQLIRKRDHGGRPNLIPPAPQKQFLWQKRKSDLK